jgi:hypothetical protein
MEKGEEWQYLHLTVVKGKTKNGGRRGGISSEMEL